jgi:hypothetical protein
LDSVELLQVILASEEEFGIVFKPGKDLVGDGLATLDGVLAKNIHGYLRQIFEAFGPERSFWGTDITRMPCSYRQCVTMFTEELPWLRGRDLERVMGGAIVDWLGWEHPASPSARPKSVVSPSRVRRLSSAGRSRVTVTTRPSRSIRTSSEPVSDVIG